MFDRGLIATVALIACVLAGCGEAPPDKGVRGARAAASSAGADRARIRAVVRRFNLASLAGDSGAMCALVDPAKLRYLEQIGHAVRGLHERPADPRLRARRAYQHDHLDRDHR